MVPSPLANLVDECTIRPRPWAVPALVALVAAGLFLVGLGNHVLWDYHEPYVGGIIHEMSINRNWVVPTLNGQPYLEKPPLFYLMGVLSCRLAGTFDPWALRLPSALLAMGTAVWVSWLGCRLQSARAGLWAGILAATQVLFFEMGHRAVVDMTLTAAVTLALGLAFLALLETSRLWVQLFWASLGLVFLAKGVIGPVMVLWPVAVVLAVQRDSVKRSHFLRPGWGLALGGALILAWCMPLAFRGGTEFLTEVFLRNTLGRFLKLPELVSRTGTLEEHREPFTFYLARTPGNVLPWLALWAPALVPTRKGGVRAWGLSAFFLATLLLLSLSSGKRMVYLLPVLPITFLQTGLWLDRALRGEPGRVVRGALWTTVVLVLILGAGLPWFVVLRVGMPQGTALGMSLPAVVLGLVAVVLAFRRSWAAALGWTLGQWSLTIIAFLVLAVPHLDREWNPLLEPYKTAKKLEEQGAMVFQGRLGEGQVGFINLTFGHRLTPAATEEAVRTALARPEPVVLLLEARLFRNGAFGAVLEGALEVPTEASRGKRLWDRAPVLLVNRAAQQLLDHSRDLGLLSSRRPLPAEPFARPWEPRV